MALGRVYQNSFLRLRELIYQITISLSRTVKSMTTDMRNLIRIVEDAVPVNEVVVAYKGMRSTDVAFKMGHIGDNSHTFGSYQSKRWGVFFSDNPTFAGIYGEVAKYILNIQNTLDMHHDRHVLEDFEDSLDPFDAIERPLWQKVRSLQQTWQWFEDELGESFVAFLRARNYDSASFREYLEDGGSDEHESTTTVVLDTTLIRRA